MSTVDIQQFQFYKGNIDYVLINIAVGERHKMPPTVVTRKLKQFRQESNLCKVLKEAGIPCDIMPAYVNDFNGSAIQINGQDLAVKIEEMDAEIEDISNTGQCNVDELRSELVDAGTLKEGLSITDFGLLDNVNVVDDESQAKFKQPTSDFKARSLTTSEMDNRMKVLDDIIHHPFD